MKKSPENPLAKMVDDALRQAAKKVVKRAEESGTPVIICEDGEVKRVDPRKTQKNTKTEIRKLKTEN
jgi:hypothetical protein